MQIKFSQKISSNNLIVLLSEEMNLDSIPEVSNFKEAIREAIKIRKFEGKKGQRASLVASCNGVSKYLVLYGIGKAADFNGITISKIGGAITSSMKCTRIDSASVLFESLLLKNDTVASVAFGAALKNYSFNKYKSPEKLKDFVELREIEFVCSDSDTTRNNYEDSFKPIVDSVYFSRDLVSEPANIIYPESFVERAKAELGKFDVKIETLGIKEMKELGMNALLGVGQGSARESKLLVMQYMGGDKNEAPLAFVGKGVTFDTGGISLKPSENMEDMKYDMGGASIVTGLIRALAARKAKVNVVAVAGLVENMPDGNAQRPSDVVRSMSGQTIEVINTDAEGRLVLADALWYTQSRFKPKLMIDLATLTGAIIVALSNQHAGLFSNDEELARDLLSCGIETGEKLWQLPLNEDYDKMIDSQIADVRNTSTGKGGGSITAAQFLQRFVNKTKWAHLDIAGMAWSTKDADLNPIGATGFGLRLLNNFVKKYEK